MAFIVKNTTYPNLFDLLVPHYCRGCGSIGSILCERCKNNIIKNHQILCPNCKNPTPSGRCPDCDLGTVYNIGERTELLDELIHDYKYSSIRTLKYTFADILNSTIPDFPSNSIIIPLPTSRKHIRARALDHTYEIAKQLAKKRHIKVERILLRAKDSVQVGSDRATRIIQADSAYTIPEKIHLNPSTTYILFDDIWTTGASMKSAVKKLQQAGAENIIILLLAVSRLKN